MKKSIIKAISIVLAFALLSTPAAATETGTGNAVYRNTTQIGDGFSYTNEISYNSADKRVEKFYTQLSPDSDIYPIIMACDTIYGGMTQKNVISYAESLGYNVVSAVNSDFFNTANGIPLGIVIENGEYRSSPEGRNALYFSDNGTGVIENVTVHISLYNNGGGEFADDVTGENNSNAGKTVEISHFNKMRKNGGGMYLFSSAFSTVSTRTSTDGWAVRFKIIEGEMTVSGEMTLEVAEKYEGTEALAIGDEYLILTADTTSGLYHEFEKFAVGDVVTLSTSCGHAALSDAKWATGCGDVLVSNGQITDTGTWDSALFGYHPRTVIGIKSNGEIVSYVVEGRLKDRSYGAKLSETAEDLIGLGCVTVINMDGGGSSAMSLRLPGSNSCTVVNRLSDTYQRKCSTYILFVTNMPPDSVPNRLFIAEDGAVILAGASADLNFLATDSGYRTVSSPETVKALSLGLGTVKGGIYTAGTHSGTDTVSLYGDGISGKGTLHIISAADKIEIFDSHANEITALDSVSMDSTVQLNAIATYHNRDIIMDPGTIRFSVEGDIGTITKDGLFTAQGVPGTTGTITVSGAGISKTIPVAIKPEFLDTKGHWAETYIDELYHAGIINGTSNSTFSPDDNMTRGDFVLLLWRAAGKQNASIKEIPFKDVSEADYFAEAIKWAAEQGIARGDDSGKFNPRGHLTRQDAFTLVYRVLHIFGYTDIPEDESVLTRFSDVSEISAYAQDSITALVGLGIVEGSDGSMRPKSNIMRCEIAKMVCASLYGRI